MELSGAIVGALTGLVVLSLALAVTLCVVAWHQMGVIRRMGDQLIANSDYQLRRIEMETVGTAQSRASEEYAAALKRHAASNGTAGTADHDEEPEVSIPGRA